MRKMVFSFDDKSLKKLKIKKYFKEQGSNLAEMGRLGLPVLQDSQ